MKLTLNGFDFDVRDVGPRGAPALVFLHGFPFDQTMWNAEVSLLSDRCRVITFDQRGHGKTGAVAGPYMIEFLVDDVMALLDHLQIPKAILCGLSMGGYVALRAVERQPDRVQALILCDTRSEADSNEAKLKRAANIRTVKEKGVPAFAESFLKAIFAPSTLRDKPDVVAGIRQVIEQTAPEAITGTLLSLAARTDTTASLSAIKIPTLILVGEDDAVTPPQAAESLHQKIAGSCLVRIPSAGHLSNLENPTAFQRALVEFLESLG